MNSPPVVAHCQRPAEHVTALLAEDAVLDDSIADCIVFEEHLMAFKVHRVGTRELKLAIALGALEEGA
jgi:hypothetical protein